MADSITKDHKDYRHLLDIWVAQKRPVNLVVGKRHYRVITPSDDEVVFVPQEGFENYASQTHIPGS